MTWAQEFVKFTPAQFKKYIEYCSARWSAYNIIWVLCGEFDEAFSQASGSKPQNIYVDYINHLKDNDPYGHPIGLHPGGEHSSGDFGYGYDHVDFIGQQHSYNVYNEIISDLKYGKPVINLEYCYAGWHDTVPGHENLLLQGAIDIITAGGYYTAGFFETFAPDKGGWNPGAHSEKQAQIAGLNGFWKSLPMNRLFPYQTELYEQAMKSEFDEYLIFDRTEIIIPDGQKIYYDPITTGYSDEKPIGEYLLLITQEDNEPPSRPTGLKIIE